jgi:hypothetical protein
MMEIPTDEDWLPIDPDDLDRACAYRNFHGKSFQDAVRRFEASYGRPTEDLMYMPPRVFGFYLKAYTTYVMSRPFEDGPEDVSSFIHLIRFKAEHDPEILRPDWSSIEQILKHIVEHQTEYDAEWISYGSFRSIAREIVGLGFEVTFDTEAPESVPESATIGDMASSFRQLSLPVALQILRNSGIGELDESSTRDDIIRVLGQPDLSGGGEHPIYGKIPVWIRYDRSFYCMLFQFDGERISAVNFMPPPGSLGGPLSSAPKTPTLPSSLDALSRFERLWRDPDLPDA